MDVSLFKRLELDPAQQVHHIAVRAYQESREKIFERIPEMRAAYQHLSHSANDEFSFKKIEMFLWAFSSLDRLKNVGDCTNECRDTLDALLSFVCGHGDSWMLSPVLLDWLFTNALIAERRNHNKGLRKIFKSKEFTMLDRLVCDFESGIQIKVLRDRLKVVESHGVFFNPKLFDLLEIRAGLMAMEKKSS